MLMNGMMYYLDDEIDYLSFYPQPEGWGKS
jgi:hypothetical protein